MNCKFHSIREAYLYIIFRLIRVRRTPYISRKCKLSRSCIVSCTEVFICVTDRDNIIHYRILSYLYVSVHNRSVFHIRKCDLFRQLISKSISCSELKIIIKSPFHFKKKAVTICNVFVAFQKILTGLLVNCTDNLHCSILVENHCVSGCSYYCIVPAFKARKDNSKNKQKRQNPFRDPSLLHLSLPFIGLNRLIV